MNRMTLDGADFQDGWAGIGDTAFVFFIAFFLAAHYYYDTAKHDRSQRQPLDRGVFRGWMSWMEFISMQDRKGKPFLFNTNNPRENGGYLGDIREPTLLDRERSDS